MLLKKKTPLKTTRQSPKTRLITMLKKLKKNLAKQMLRQKNLMLAQLLNSHEFVWCIWKPYRA